MAQKKSCDQRDALAVDVVLAWRGSASNKAGGEAKMSSTKIIGPITGGLHGWPFGATVRDLASLGYQEEEYFFEGTAKAFAAVGNLGVDGRWNVEVTGKARFKTRMLVRRPIEPERFNGVVVVVWNNETVGFDIITDTPGTYDGCAVVAVTVQRTGLNGLSPGFHGLTRWDSERYGDLELSSDAYTYDIFTQAARAVGPMRRNGGVDPMGGLKVKYVVAQGYSQSTNFLVSYWNAIQPIERAFDGMLLAASHGAGFGFTSSELDLGSAGLEIAGVQMPEMPDRVPTRIRDDLDAPVMVVNTESETLSMLAVRQPDSAHYRFWEVAGSSHVPGQLVEFYKELFLREKVPYVVEGVDTSTASRVSWFLPFDAALHHLCRWIDEGVSPPMQPRIDIKFTPLEGESRACGLVEVLRDELGFACGGLRLPDVTVPVAVNTAESGFSGLPMLLGSNVKFGPEDLRRRYGSEKGYLEEYRAAVVRAMEEGLLLERDAENCIAGAKRFKFSSS